MSLYTSLRPAGGSFTVNIADNQASSGLYKKVTSDWTDGGQHPDFVRTILFSNFIFLTLNRTVQSCQ